MCEADASRYADSADARLGHQTLHCGMFAVQQVVEGLQAPTTVLTLLGGDERLDRVAPPLAIHWRDRENLFGLGSRVWGVGRDNRVLDRILREALTSDLLNGTDID